MKEENSKIYQINVPIKAILFGLTVCLVLIFSSIEVYSLTHTYNALSILIVSLFAVINFIYAIPVQKGFTSNKGTLASYIIATAILVLAMGTGIYLLYYIYTSNFKWTIQNPNIAILFLFATIIVAYLGNIFVEKWCGEEYWRVGRLLSEDIITIIYTTAFAIIGPTLAFFGVKKLDSYLAFLAILVSFIPARGKISSVLSIRKIKEFNESIKTQVNNWLSKLPVVKSLISLDVRSIWRFCHISIRVSVSRLIKDRESDLIDTIAIPIIDFIGTVERMEIKVEYSEEHDIVVAIPVTDDKKVSEALSDKFILFNIGINNLNVASSEEFGVKEKSEIPDSIIIRRLAEKHVDVLCMRSVSDTLKNLADGWFIIVASVTSDDPNSALNEAIDVIKSRLS